VHSGRELQFSKILNEVQEKFWIFFFRNKMKPGTNHISQWLVGPFMGIEQKTRSCSNVPNDPPSNWFFLPYKVATSIRMSSHSQWCHSTALHIDTTICIIRTYVNVNYRLILQTLMGGCANSQSLNLVKNMIFPSSLLCQCKISGHNKLNCSPETGLNWNEHKLNTIILPSCKL